MIFPRRFLCLALSLYFCRYVLVVQQAEYDAWCTRYAHIFKSVESDTFELNRCKSVLHLASGGNPLLLESFREKVELVVLSSSLFLHQSFTPMH